MEPTVTFRTAEAMTLGELTPLLNRAYAAYFVPLSYDVPHIAWHLTRSDIARAVSVVGDIDGEPFGVSLAGVRGARAWIGGFGIAIEHRRKGLATRLMAEQLARLRTAGIDEVGLEVISQNPARKLYRHAGFEEIRELLVFGGAPARGSATLDEISVEELSQAHAKLHAAPPTWRRQVPTLVQDVEAGADPLALRRAGEVAAFAVVEARQGRLSLHDAAAADVQAARSLFGALAERWRDLDMRLIDEAAGTPVAEAATAAGLSVGLTQVEMRALL